LIFATTGTQWLRDLIDRRKKARDRAQPVTLPELDAEIRELEDKLASMMPPKIEP
jgi:hypothetical protein